MRGRQEKPLKAKVTCDISIHAPMRGRPYDGCQTLGTLIFQSTPPCGGDTELSKREGTREISIHAPMRGRQTVDGLTLEEIKISIHAPMRGRLRGVPGLIVRCGFQSTPPCGGDGLGWSTSRRECAISIHAPMRGRRGRGNRSRRDSNHFNPRPHAGATPRHDHSITVIQFQSTPPCGGDRALRHVGA